MKQIAQVVVVGSELDQHVGEVIALVRPKTPVLVCDSHSLSVGDFALQDGRFEISSERDGKTIVNSTESQRGWIRRLAPPDWMRGVIIESHDAAVKTAWLALLTSFIRTSSVRWLTSLDQLVRAENKLVQYQAARNLGILVPDTLVCSSGQIACEVLGPQIVLKPLGTGHYYESNEAFVVYAVSVGAGAPELDALSTAPFLAQRLIPAAAHLRVVTVKGQCWGARLDASELPIDWRAVPIAHRSFEPTVLPLEVAEGATAISAELGLGYSSQDWIMAKEGCYLVDVNPGGQWLFLPPAVANPATAALADWLIGTTE